MIQRPNIANRVPSSTRFPIASFALDVIIEGRSTSGQLVRELLKSECGPLVLHFGHSIDRGGNMTEGLRVLYEDNHLLVVDKPAGTATMGAESGMTAHRWAADYLRANYGKPGRVFVGIVSRLDVVTSGVLVLARTSKAASRLVPQFGATSGGSPRSRAAASKVYLAAVEGTWESARGELQDQVWKDDAARRMRTVGKGRAGAQEARLRYRKLGDCAGGSILAVALITGRKHQIRTQFADRGHPIWGDRKYGGTRKFPAGIGLHSWRLEIEHPTRKSRMEFVADVPESWGRFRGQTGCGQTGRGKAGRRAAGEARLGGAAGWTEEVDSWVPEMMETGP